MEVIFIFKFINMWFVMSMVIFGVVVMKIVLIVNMVFVVNIVGL